MSVRNIDCEVMIYGIVIPIQLVWFVIVLITFFLLLDIHYVHDD